MNSMQSIRLIKIKVNMNGIVRVFLMDKNKGANHVVIRFPKEKGEDGYHKRTGRRPLEGSRTKMVTDKMVRIKYYG